MIEIKQRLTSFRITDAIENDHMSIIHETTVREIINFLLPEFSNVWVAPLPPSVFRLMFTYDALDGPIKKVEIMESKRTNGPNHARLYLTPQVDHIPTLIIGEYTSVAHYAWLDRRPAFPLPLEAQELPVGSTALHYPDELSPLPGVTQVLQLQKIMYTVRPTSFLLQKTSLLETGGTIIKAKVYENQFAPKDIFCHITSPEEWNEALPGVLHGIVLTNSEKYIKTHSGLGFIQANAR